MASEIEGANSYGVSFVFQIFDYNRFIDDSEQIALMTLGDLTISLSNKGPVFSNSRLMKSKTLGSQNINWSRTKCGHRDSDKDSSTFGETLYHACDPFELIISVGNFVYRYSCFIQIQEINFLKRSRDETIVPSQFG